LNLDELHLKEKALLLLRRERELFEMRAKHAQVTEWLRLTQLLPQLFDRTLPIPTLYQRLRKGLISGLRLQRVAFIELTPRTYRAMAPPGDERELSPELAELLTARKSGLCNEPTEPGLRALAETAGLHRFLWSEIRVPGRHPVLLLAGFDRAGAAFQNVFDESDAAHIDNVAQHVQTLLGNMFLLSELETEKDRLQQTNETLERQERELQVAGERLRTTNESLEERVTERTEALALRTRDMRLVLDNVSQAFMTIDREGHLAQERSAMVDAWFGPYHGTPRFADYITPIDAHFASMFDLGYESVLEEILTRELTVAQLPARLQHGERKFSCTYELLTEGESISGLLIVASDVTDQLRRAREEIEQQELLALFQGLMRDRAGYIAFTDEAGEIMEGLADESFELVIVKRQLHTLKGIAAMAGATVIAELCHKAEDELDEDQTVLPRATIGLLVNRWKVVTEALYAILGDRRRGVVEVTSKDLEALAQQIRRGAPATDLLALLSLWQLEPVQLPLDRLAQYARALAKRLGKADLVVAIDAPPVRLDLQRWGGLWSSLIQVVRNAVDHGIETPRDRLARGKSPAGRLNLRLHVDDAALSIVIEDDGRGIDWDRVRAVAAQKGMPSSSHEHLVMALLAPGFTTRHEVTETSGRGVGLSVVQDHVAGLGGSVAVTGTSGGGCSWRLTFPIAGLHASDATGLTTRAPASLIERPPHEEPSLSL
jgi:HPt (histidine-containing phosphotransfer) domain-containing protein